MMLTIQIDDLQLDALKSQLRISPEDYDKINDVETVDVNGVWQRNYAHRIMLARRILELSVRREDVT